MRKWICILLAMLICLPAFAEAKPEWFDQYENVLPLNCDPVRYICMHRDSRLCDLRDADGKLLQENYISGVDSPGDFRGGYAIAYSPGEEFGASFIDEHGELISDFRFYNGGWYGDRFFNEGLCCLTFMEEGQYGCIDTEGRVVIEPIYDFLGIFSEGLTYFRRGDQRGYLNTRGEVVIEVDFDAYLGGFYNGLSQIESEQGLYGYINAKGEMVIPANFRNASDFSEGLAAVETMDETMGWIRPDGSFAIEPKYLSAGDFQNGIATAAVGAGYMTDEYFSGEITEKRLYGLIDTEGEVVLPLIYDEVYLQRGVNLDENEITATAWVGDSPHYFRIEDGRAVEIAGLIRDYEAEERLQKASAPLDSACIEFDESHELPYFQCMDFLRPLKNLLAAATGYDQVQTIHYEVRRYANCNDTDPEYPEVLTDAADVKFGTAPSARDAQYGKYKITPVARDALAFIVAEDHPLDELSMEELKAIYSGEITHWAELGAETAGKITAYQHKDFYQSQLSFESLMSSVILMEPPMEFLDGDYGDYANPCDFRSLPGGIGFCMKSMLDAALVGEVKILSIDGHLPGEEGYPAMVDIFAVSDANEDNPNVQVLIDWVLSEQGQDMIEKAGYVGVN